MAPLKINRPRRTAALWLLGLGVGLPLTLYACSIPVFRFALDRWSADAYTLRVNAADAKDPEIARFLRNLGDDAPYNLQAERLGADRQDTSSLWAPATKGQLPDTPVWQGVLTPATLTTLVDSPTRAKLVKGLTQGDSAVWIFVSDGSPAARAAADHLRQRLNYLQEVAELPEIDPTDPSSKLGPGPALTLRFSLLEVEANQPEERSFLRMLAGPETLDASTAPWVAAVFGRGRVLGAWAVDDLDDAGVDDVCLFLIGACSCQAKRLNPGWDLLLQAPWDQLLQEAEKQKSTVGESPAAPTPPSTPLLSATEPETVQISGVAESTPEETTTAPQTSWRLWTALVFVLGGAFIFLNNLKPKAKS